jgi:hypothetical protein
VKALAGHATDVVIAIDAPRTPSQGSRAWYWDKNKARRPRAVTERGWGRHCEVVLSVTRLANPQWTPPMELAPGWMRFGFNLFGGLCHLGAVIEVFPSASYSQLETAAEPVVELSFAGFAKGPKDALGRLHCRGHREGIHGRTWI